MVEVSDDQQAILGADQFDYRVHTLNKWIRGRGEAALALGVEINGIERGCDTAEIPVCLCAAHI